MPIDITARLILTVKRAALRAYVKAGAFKTEGTYRRQVWRIVRDLYNGEIDEFQFVDDFSSFIDNQFGRAWREGARDMNVNPNQFVDADIEALAQRIEAEQGYMLQLADDILTARTNQSGLEQFRTRADMYANRYTDVVSQARVHFGGKQMLMWKRGPTEQGCEDCTKLDGIVASADEWAKYPLKPRARDLACNGYNCLCELSPTDQPPTPGGIPA